MQGGIGLKHPNFIDDAGSFILERPEDISQLYFPLASETGLKSCVSPNLGGDSKLDQETFLLEPVSIENLHNNRSTRNFWLVGQDGTAISLTGASAAQEAVKFTPQQDDSRLTAGFMWHTLERVIRHVHIHATLTSFVPVADNVEILLLTVENQGAASQCFTPYAAIPLYGRSADNLRDHRNVTCMLHRIRTTEHGILVRPTMSFFDERVHRRLHEHADGQKHARRRQRRGRRVRDGGSSGHERRQDGRGPGVRRRQLHGHADREAAERCLLLFAGLF